MEISILNEGINHEDGAPEPGFLTTLVTHYVKNLDRFLDKSTGAVREPTRDDKTPSFLFSEVTGYAIRNLLLLHSLTGADEYFQRARQAARWLTEYAWHKGWIRTRYYFEKDKEEAQRLYSFHWGNILPFDNGICLGGLSALCKAANNPALIKRAAELADNLVERVESDGSISPFLNIYGNDPGLPESPRWSQQKGSFHTKIAESLVEFAKITGNENYNQAARKICRYALSFQEEDGRFITDRDGITQLHPHCYSAEGILSVGIELGDKDLVDAARRAVEWALRQCSGNKKSRVPQEIGPKGPLNESCRTDALAQVLGLGCRLIQGGYLDDSWWEILSSLARGVWSMKDPQEGYFRYGTYENGEPSSTLSYWTNMFAFHSLLDYCTAWVSRNTLAVVLAGGIGSRCWPVSCEDNPKPLSRGFFGDLSLLEITTRRILHSGCVRPENLFVVASKTGVALAKEQMDAFRIPKKNIIMEKNPSGTLRALALAVDKITGKGKDILLVTMSDNLIEPDAAFRDTLMRAALAAYWQSKKGEGAIVSLGIPGRPYDPRFGHDIYNREKEILRWVYGPSQFIEKPKSPPELNQGEDFAWNSGSIISTLKYFKECLTAKHDKKRGKEDISYHLLEEPDVVKAVALYPANVRFIDLGSPGKDLLSFFSGTKYAATGGNIVLGSGQAGVVFVKSSRNLVVCDKIPIEVVGISDHLIIDNGFTNVAVAMPLNRVDTLPVMYRMLENVDGLHPYIKGGMNEPEKLSHHLAWECSGQCDTGSSYGLALAVFCTDIRVERRQDRLRVVGTGSMDLSMEDVDIVMSKKSDPRLVRHLLEVTAVAWMLADPIGLSSEAKRLLHFFCLCHDIGGYLTDESIALERELEALIGNISSLDWKTIDSEVLLKLALSRAGGDMNPQLEKFLATINDNVQSALHVLELEQLRSYPHLDELLYLVCNQERPPAFRLPLDFRSGIDPNDLVKVFSCFKVAETWVQSHCAWKKKLRPHLWEKREGGRAEEDIARFMAFICRTLEDANVHPKQYLDVINDAMLAGPESRFRRYTCRDLRCTDELEGKVNLVPLYVSDKVYLEFMRRRREGANLNDLNSAIDNALDQGRDFEYELLFLLPHHLRALAKYGLVDLDDVKRLAIEIMQRCLNKNPQLWEKKNLEKARNELIECLK